MLDRGEDAEALSCFGRAIDSVKNGAFELKWCFDNFVQLNTLTYAVKRSNFPDPGVFIHSARLGGDYFMTIP